MQARVLRKISRSLEKISDFSECVARQSRYLDVASNYVSTCYVFSARPTTFGYIIWWYTWLAYPVNSVRRCSPLCSYGVSAFNEFPPLDSSWLASLHLLCTCIHTYAHVYVYICTYIRIHTHERTYRRMIASLNALRELAHESHARVSNDNPIPRSKERQRWIDGIGEYVSLCVCASCTGI